MRHLRVVDTVLILLISYLASAVAFFLLGRHLSIRANAGVSAVVLLAVSWIWVRMLIGDVNGYVGIRKPRAVESLIALWGAFAIILPAMAVEALFMRYYKMPPELIDALMELVGARTFGELGYAIAVAAAGAAISEEFVFRGILLRSLSNRIGSYWALIISSLVFSIMHTWRFPSALVIGIYLGYLFLATGSIVPCLFAHFGINCVSIIGIFVSSRIGEESLPFWLREESPAPFWLLLPSLIAFAWAVVVIHRKLTAGVQEPSSEEHSGYTEHDLQG